jgi:hypothetical protein
VFVASDGWLDSQLASLCVSSFGRQMERPQGFAESIICKSAMKIKCDGFVTSLGTVRKAKCLKMLLARSLRRDHVSFKSASIGEVIFFI